MKPHARSFTIIALCDSSTQRAQDVAMILDGFFASTPTWEKDMLCSRRAVTNNSTSGAIGCEQAT
eukprot:6164333-Amphidinium_carterae.2